MTQLASALRGPAGRPVVNETGIEGGFDFVLEFASDLVPVDQRRADAPPGLFTALKEQIGLVVIPTDATLPTLVIDQIDRPDPD